MEQKKVTYTGLDTEDVTQMLEEGNRKQAEKGWQEYGWTWLQLLHRPGDLCPGRARRGRRPGPGRGRRIVLPPLPIPPPRRLSMVIGLIVGILFCAGVLFFQHRNKDQ